MLRPSWVVVLPALALALAACDRRTPTEPAPTVARAASIEILDPPAYLLVGDTVRLRAATLDSAGGRIDRPVSWSASFPHLATVDSLGTMVALAPGKVNVTAMADGVRTAATVPVTRRADSLAVSPRALSVGVARTLRLVATPTGAEGDTIHEFPIRWESSDSSVAQVVGTGSLSGTVWGHGAGTAVVVAIAGEARASTTVTVAEPVAAISIAPRQAGGSLAVYAGDTLPLVAQVYADASGNREATGSRQLSWWSTDRSVATVSSEGVVSGVAPGSTYIHAASEGVASRVHITVSGRLAAVKLTFYFDTLLYTEEKTYVEAVGVDSWGSPVPNQDSLPWDWAITDPDVATLSRSPTSPRGATVWAKRAGRATITASVGGINASGAITVLGRVVEVRLEPTSLALASGEARRLTPTLRDAEGNVLTDRPIRWSSSDYGVALVSAHGVVTGGAGGTATVTATAEGKSATATVTVAGPPASTTGPWVEIAAGGGHTCGRTRDGKTYCWGEGGQGQLGSAPLSSTGTPRAVQTGIVFRSLSATYRTTCGVDDAGEAYCWGRGWDASINRRAPGFRMAGIRVAPWRAGFCGLATDGSIVCGSPTGEYASYAIPGSYRAVTGRLVAIDAQGRLLGRSGDGWSVSDLPGDFVDVTGENDTACALRSDGTLFCTTGFHSGPGGNRSRYGWAEIPTDLRLARASAGGRQVCGLTSEGRGYCWNLDLEWSGSSAAVRFHGPEGISAALRFAQISAGGDHTCGITTEGAAYCWGSNESGQLGAGAIGGASTGPARVRDP